MSGRPCCDGTRVFACALVTGLLFASLTGFQAGQSADGDGASTNTSVRLGFAPVPAILGALAGALAGAGVGFAWGRPGFVGLVGMALVAALGALVGLVIAGLTGAESRTFVEGNAVGTEYGPRPGVLAAGAAVGAAIGAAVAWRFRARPADRA
jgi:hypothetical protein